MGYQRSPLGPGLHVPTHMSTYRCVRAAALSLLCGFVTLCAAGSRSPSHPTQSRGEVSGLTIMTFLNILFFVMTAVGFEPTQLALVELESTPLDHSGKLSCLCTHLFVWFACLVRLAAFCDSLWGGLFHSVGFELRLNPQQLRQHDAEGIRTPAGRAQWISSPSP